MTAMGYASYPLYLFQRIIFTFYLPLMYIGTLTHHYDMYIGNEDPWKGGPWFEQLPLLVKMLCVMMLTGTNSLQDVSPLTFTLILVLIRTLSLTIHVISLISAGLCYVVQMVVQDHIVARVYVAILKWTG